MHVARELIAQKDQGQRAVGRMPPMIEGAFNCLFERSGKTLADLSVELGRPGPPDLAWLAVVGVS